MLLGKSAGLFRAGGTVAGSARFHEVDAVVEFALLAGIEGFHGAVVAHDARVHGAAGAVLGVFA
jgi:hypothetical protein